MSMVHEQCPPMLQRVVVPSRLALIYRAGQTLGYNPLLNTWELVDEVTAEALRWLRAGRPRGELHDHLGRRFPSLRTGIDETVQKLLAWCILRRLLFAPARRNGVNVEATVGWPILVRPPA